MELLFEPDRNRLEERAKTRRGECEIGLEQPLEFEHRLVVKAHVVELPRSESRLPQAVIHGVLRKLRVVLFARESLFLRGGNDLAVDDERRGRVVVERGNAEN